MTTPSSSTPNMRTDSTTKSGKKKSRGESLRSPGIQLPAGISASALLHQLLRNAATRHPAALSSANIPTDAERFRADFAEVLVRFEAARVASNERTDIARSIADEAHSLVTWLGEDGRSLSLAECFAEGREALPVKRVVFEGTGGLRPNVRYQDRNYDGPAGLRALGDELATRALATRGAADSLGALAAHLEAHGGTLDLRGRRFAVLGANAELSPVTLLLEAGADVLWIDVTPPSGALLASRDLRGSLSYVETSADLLLAPHAVAATVARFADEQPVDLVLAAYAPGSGREWRLQAAMNAIVRALDPSLVRGVALYISPTTPSVLQPDAVDAAARHVERVPAWQRALALTGALQGASFVHGDVAVARALVPIQGVSYQAAQYVEKILAAERFAMFGTQGGAMAPNVSANVAPITATRSLSHPLFQAGFIGAVHLGVEVFQPETTRPLSALLMLSDLLGLTTRKGAPDAAALFAAQVHGGVFTMAYGLNEAIRVAALLGMTRRPALLMSALFRR